jgi:hypothetical protein
VKEKSMNRHVAPFSHITMILNQTVFVLYSYCCVLSRKATNTNFIVLCLTCPGLEPKIYHTWSKHDNHYTTDAVSLSKVIVNNCHNLHIHSTSNFLFPYLKCTHAFANLEKIWTSSATIKSRSQHHSVSESRSCSIRCTPCCPWANNTWQWYCNIEK